MEIIKKAAIPESLNCIKKLFKTPYKGINWNDERIGENRKKLRKHILDNEQKGKCAYCSCRLELESSHIDHFLKRELFEEKTFCHNNLFVSCLSNNHCANYKDNLLKHLGNNIEARNINKKLISPIENITDFIVYDMSCFSFPKRELNSSDKERAELTIKYFNFNHEELKQIRFNLLKSILITLKGIPQENFDNWTISLLNQTPLKDLIISLLPNLKKLVSNKEILDKYIKSTYINSYGLLNAKS